MWSNDCVSKHSYTFKKSIYHREFIRYPNSFNASLNEAATKVRNAHYFFAINSNDFQKAIQIQYRRVEKKIREAVKRNFTTIPYIKLNKIFHFPGDAHALRPGF